MTENRRLALQLKYFLLIGIVGWIASLYTLWHRAKVKAGVGLGESFCNINSSVNCDAIALSSFSQIGPVSVSTLGLMFFAVVIVLAFRGIRQVRNNYLGILTKQCLLGIGILGAIASVALFLVSVFKIGAFCLVCGVVYLLNFSLLFLGWRIYKSKISSKSDFVENSLLLIVLAVICLQNTVQPLANYAARQIPIQSEEELPPEVLISSVQEYNSGNAYEIPVQKSPAVGDASAPVTVVEFSDFECPHCAVEHKGFPTAIRGLEDKVRIIFKNYPLDPACNSGGVHRKACAAAYAARCVFKKQGIERFREMQDYLFENQEEFTAASIKKKAESLGLSAKDYDECVENNDIKEEVNDEIELGKSLGVQGTPTLYVNGKQLKAGTSQDIMRAVIQSILKK